MTKLAGWQQATDPDGGAGTASDCERAFELSPVSMLRLGPAREILGANLAFERFTGHARERLLGRTLDTLVHARDRLPADAWPDDDDDAARAPVEASFGEASIAGPAGPPVSGPHELRFVRADGSTVWGELHVAALGAGAHAATIVDIDAHKDLERKLGSLAAVVEFATDLVLVFDTSLEVQYINAAGLRILGLDPENGRAGLVGSCVLDAVWPEDLPRIEAEAVPALRATGSWSGRLRYRNFRTGEPIETLWNVSAIRDANNETAAWTTISPDLGEMLATEHALQEKSDALAAADRHKDRVLSRLGHEMRNPMNALVNGLDVVAFSTDALERDEVVAMMQRQTRQLAALIDDLVDVARVQAGQLRIERRVRELAPFVRQVIDERRFETQRLGVRLEFRADEDEASPRVAFDEARLRQVLHNLLGNALRAVSGTTRPGRIGVSVTVDAANDDALVRVTDNGWGIEPAQLEEIFQPFERGNASPGDAGLGLGLAIARELVAGHGGRLEAASDGHDRGATFTMVLPLAPPAALGGVPAVGDAQATSPIGTDLATIAAAANDACAQGSSNASERPKKVLLIDDDVDSLDVLHRILKRFGHDAYQASDGRAGVALALELQPDVVICDIGMPGMNGYSVARALRKRLDLSATRLIGLTGYADVRTAAKVLEAGFDRHVAKPIDAAGLRALVETRGAAPAAASGRAGSEDA